MDIIMIIIIAINATLHVGLAREAVLLIVQTLLSMISSMCLKSNIKCSLVIIDKPILKWLLMLSCIRIKSNLMNLKIIYSTFGTSLNKKVRNR